MSESSGELIFGVSSETSPEKLSSGGNFDPDSPGIICATPPLRKKRTLCETSPSLLQHSLRRRKLLKQPSVERIGINCSSLFHLSPDLERIGTDESSPIDDNFPPTANLNVNEGCEASQYRISPFKESPMKDDILFPVVKATQVIEEVDTCAFQLMSPQMKNKGWKPEEKISAILSAERARRSICRELVEPAVEKSNRKRKMNKETALGILESFKKDYHAGCEVDGEGWLDFHVIDVFDCDPLMVRASGEQGIVMILLTEDVLKNRNALGAGSILRIYSPWETTRHADEVFYTSIAGCEVRCVDGRRLEEKVELREIPVEPFLNPRVLMRAILCEDDN